jgi:hypothetical protein
MLYYKEIIMAMKQPGRKIYRSANGKNIDLDLLISRNELTPAVGNVKVNARGDELGPGGRIARKKEDVLKDYYNTESGVKNETPKAKVKPEQAKETPKAVEPTRAEAEEWSEDDEGNFVKKPSTTRKR